MDELRQAAEDGIDLTSDEVATIFVELDATRARLRGIEARAQAWDHPDATEAERHVARHILGRRRPC